MSQHRRVIVRFASAAVVPGLAGPFSQYVEANLSDEPYDMKQSSLGRLPIYVRQHILGFVGPAGGTPAEASSLYLSLQPRWDGSGWAFVSGLRGGRSRLRWGFWDKPERERAFLHAASSRYLDFTALVDTDGQPKGWIIPRIVHTIWLGGPPPPHVEAMHESWRTQHPDWEHWLWTDADVEGQRLPEGFKNRAAFDAAQNFGEKSDILRYEVLFQIGGLYVDSDFECLAAMHDLHRHAGLYAGLSSTGTVEVNNGLIGSRPRHPLLAAMIDDIHQRHHCSRDKAAEPCTALAGVEGGALAGLMSSFLGGAEAAALQAVVSKGQQDREAMQTIERTGPGLLTRHLIRAMLDEGRVDEEGAQTSVLVLPVPWFYPIPNNARRQEAGDAKALKEQYVRPPVTRAVHYWACSWQSK